MGLAALYSFVVWLMYGAYKWALFGTVIGKLYDSTPNGALPIDGTTLYNVEPALVLRL